MATCKVPRTEQSQPTKDPIQQALTSAQLDETFTSFLSYANPTVILRSTLGALSDLELSALLTALFSLPEPMAQKYAFHCLRLVRSSRPYMVEARAFEILGQPRLSNWHRHIVCVSTTTHVRHGEALQGVQRLIQFVIERVEQDRQKKPATSSTEGQVEPIKISTIKLVAALLGETMAVGVLSSAHTSLLRTLEKAVPHSSVKLQVLKALEELILRDHILAPDSPSPAFAALLSYVDVGSRLSEGRFVRDAEWEELAKDPSKEMPAIDVEHPIAALLLHAPVDRFPRALAGKYTKSVR